MVDDLIARCRKLLEFPGGRETAKDWPVSIPRDDLEALIALAERPKAVDPYEVLGDQTACVSSTAQPWPLSIRADHAIKRALHPVDWP